MDVMISKIKNLFWKFASHNFSDKLYLRLKYKRIMGKRLHFFHPITYTEKLQWLKLYDRNPLYTTMVDKILVKEWVKGVIGDGHVAKTIAVWDRVGDINWSALPSSFVLKCNHNSGTGVVLCRDKQLLDIDKAKTKIENSLNEDYYSYNKEWPYKNVKKKIFAEEYLSNGEGCTLTDYKFFCFNGIPKILYVSEDGSEHPKTDFYDMNYNHLPIRMRDENSVVPPAIPLQCNEMKLMAQKLSKGIPHVRVDFYLVKGRIYFGEMTFYHCGGFTDVHPEEWNIKMGSWIDLENAYSKRKSNRYEL